MHLHSFMLFTVAAACCAACGGDSTTTPAPPIHVATTVDVYTVGDAFSPAFQSVSAGDTVRWNFATGSDGLGHNVRFTAPPAGAPTAIPVQKTGTATRVFTVSGDFEYVCDVHPGMSGAILVK